MVLVRVVTIVVRYRPMDPRPSGSIEKSRIRCIIATKNWYNSITIFYFWFCHNLIQYEFYINWIETFLTTSWFFHRNQCFLVCIKLIQATRWSCLPISEQHVRMQHTPSTLKVGQILCRKSSHLGLWLVNWWQFRVRFISITLIRFKVDKWHNE